MEIKEIKTDHLLHHPDNPRSGYGDIEELTASIKEQGILQPLTVVQLGNMDRYNVVTGNRRMEAAKAAGLDTCPCIIQEMDEKTQASVILVENMVRKNLNPYEECKGVQLCLDLGMDEKEISKKTGFSKETIRHRKKMAELDQKMLKEKCEGGQITLQELISLEKIKDPEVKNSVLKKAGTNNFSYALTTAIRDEKAEEARQKAYEILITFAEEMPNDWMDSKYRQVEYNLSGDIELPDDAHETDYAFKLTWSGGKTYQLWKLREDVDEEEEDPEESEYEIARRKQDECKTKLRELGEQLFQMRKEHMKNMTYFKGNILQWMAYLLVGDDFYEENEKPKGFPWNESIYGYNGGKLYHEIMGSKDDFTAEAIVKDIGMDKPQNPVAAPTLVYSMLETGDSIGSATWQGKFDENDETFKRLYAFMELCGYELSDAEKEILDGTHKYYYKEED